MKRMLLVASTAFASIALYANAVSEVPAMEYMVDASKMVVKQVEQKKFSTKYGQSKLVAPVSNFKIADKQLKDARSRIALPKRSISPKSVNPENAALFESFEDYPGNDSIWVPTGWEVKRTEGVLDRPLNYGVGSWFISDGYYIGIEPYDGDYFGLVWWGYNEGKKQDEWLISPSFTPQSGHYLQFACFYSPYSLFDGSEENIDPTTYDYIDHEPITTMKVMISTNGGTSWSELYDIADEWMDYSYYEMYMYYMSGYITSDWYPITIDMTEYVGQEIKIALRYETNDDGGIQCIAVDDIGVGIPSPEALYLSPSDLHNGLDEAFMGINYSILLAPADTDLTWINYSNEWTESCSWEYANPADGGETMLTSTDTNLTVKYPSGYYVSPALTASREGAVDSTFYDCDAIKVGGGSVLMGNKISGASWGTYDVFTQSYAPYSDFSFSSTGEMAWNYFLFGTPTATETQNAAISYIGNLFPKAAASYTLSRVSVLGFAMTEIDPTSSYDLHVIHADDEGYMGDTLAVGHCTGSQILYPFKGEAGYEQVADFFIVLPFQLMKDDGITGMEMPTTLTVDSSIFVMLSAKNRKNSEFGVLTTEYPSFSGADYGYIGLDVVYEGEKNSDVYALSKYTEEGGSFYFNLNAQFPGGEEAGVDEVGVAESAAKVAVVGGDFVVTAPEGIDAVTVYNVAGQAVAASEVAGTTTVDAQSLAKGVYILRFNDGSTVKVMK